MQNPAETHNPIDLSQVEAASQGNVAVPVPPEHSTPRPRETGGPSGPEPTRYGDWERKGRCIDF
jgi:hypothetical protein